MPRVRARIPSISAITTGRYALKIITLALGRAVTALVLWSATAAFAGQVTFSAKAPPVGPDDISNLTGVDTPIKNVSDGDNDATCTMTSAAA